MPMTERMNVFAGSFIAVAFLLVGAAQAAQQTKEQQSCINAMNKDVLKVYVTQGKENVACLRLDQKEEATTDLDLCLTTHSTKVLARQTKATSDDTQRCSGAGQPGFGYAGAAVFNPVAQQIEIDLMEDMFKDPNDTLDVGVYACDPYDGECRCQRAVALAVEKLMAQIGNTFNKCKKYALKGDEDPHIEPADDPNDLVDCMTDPNKPLSVAGDQRGTLADNKEKILNAVVDGECVNTAIVVQEPFPGPFCNRAALGGSPTAQQLRDCLVQRAYCHVCRLINVADDLNVDCVAFSGGSCAP